MILFLENSNTDTMKRKIKHSGSLTLWHFRNKDAHPGKCQSAIVPYNIYPSYWDHYCSPQETHTLFFPFCEKEGGPLIALDLAGRPCLILVFIQTNGVAAGNKAVPPKQGVPPDTLDKVRSLIRRLKNTTFSNLY